MLSSSARACSSATDLRFNSAMSTGRASDTTGSWSLGGLVGAVTRGGRKGSADAHARAGAAVGGKVGCADGGRNHANLTAPLGRGKRFSGAARAVVRRSCVGEPTLTSNVGRRRVV